jgi:hypothetical protein
MVGLGFVQAFVLLVCREKNVKWLYLSPHTFLVNCVWGALKNSKSGSGESTKDMFP